MSTPDVSTGKARLLAGLMALLLIGVAFITIEQQNPPPAAGESAPAAEFSSGRAMTYVQQIAKNPHPLGSKEHQEVRDFVTSELTNLGANPHVQRTLAANEDWPAPYPVGAVENVIGRVDGSNSTKPIVLMAHYDSVATSPGASDDGASVAALLETLRALKAGPQLRNDVIFLFSDGEEAGLLGAKAFVAEHPWAKDIGLVMNFEARGNSGATILFETSDGNGWLIDQVAKAVPHTVTSSLLYEVYRILPNETDLSAFKDAGFDGLNFAYINGLTHYHSPLDSVENLDERSLQNHGSSALALTRHFGNLDLGDIKRDQTIFFSAAGLTLVRYPVSWATPLSAFVGLLLLAVIVLGLKKKRLSIGRLILSFFVFLLSIVISVIAGAAVWLLIVTLKSSYRSMPMGETYNSGIYMLGFVALSVALTSTLYALLRKRISVVNLAAGALLFWFIPLMAITRFVPGASYLGMWPMLFATLALGFVLIMPEDGAYSLKRFVVLFGTGLPMVALFAPMISIIFIALTVSAAGIAMMLVTLLLGLLIPHINLASTRGKWMIPASAALMSACLIIAATVTAGYDDNRPKPNSLFYGWNADTGKAVWATSDRRLDEYTSQVLPQNAEADELSDYLPLKPIFWRSKRFLKSEAPTVALTAPSVTRLDDQVVGENRVVRLRIKSTRQAPVISVSIDQESGLLGAAVDGKEMRTAAFADDSWGFNYYAPPNEGIELKLTLKPNRPVNLRVVDESYGLPEALGLAYKPRPHHMIPTIFPYSNSTLVSKSFVF